MRSPAARPREERVKVILPARMKDHRGWQDVRILNISSKGLMARAPAAPACGSYLELRRGQHVIVVRVVWSDGLQFGAQAQSRLVPSDVIEGGSPPASPAGQTAGAMTERRLLPRVQEQSHEQSRWRARGLEYMGIAAFAAVLAFLAYDASQQALARSLAAVDSSLAASNSR